uniref:Uncharacterized protein n=1 Tax=Arundo donax TaxID=35708 RepID=A0A0A9B3V4_ARUDO
MAATEPHITPISIDIRRQVLGIAPTKHARPLLS